MGKIISVWSSMHQSGKTIFLYNLLNSITEKLDSNIKVLVCCANLSKGNLMGLFNIEKSELNLEDMVNFKITSGGNVNLFEAIAKRDNIFFCGSRNTDRAYTARNIKVYEELLSDFKGEFDLILIDTMAGKESTLSNMIIKKSDYVINILSQDIEQLDKDNFKTEKDLLYIVNKYRDIYPDLRDLISNYQLGSQIFALPQCDLLQEMKNKGKLSLFMQHETAYNRALFDITVFLTRKLHLGLKEEILGSVKKKGRLKSAILNILGEAYE